MAKSAIATARAQFHVCLELAESLVLRTLQHRLAVDGVSVPISYFDPGLPTFVLPPLAIDFTPKPDHWDSYSTKISLSMHGCLALLYARLNV
jgi:hypothetical protein